MGLSSFNSRHIVLSGVSRGVGQALAHTLLEHGAHLSVCARTAEPLQNFQPASAVNAHTLSIVDRPAVDRWIADGVRSFGAIDAVIHNAAVLGPMTAIAAYPAESWAQVMEINVTGTFQVTQSTLPHLVRPGGVFLYVSSYLGRHGLERYGAYAASKFGVEGLAQVVADEHRNDGIISCAVDPGMIQTDMLRAAMGTDDVSDHHTTAEAAQAFLKLLQDLRLEHSGQPINLWS